MTVSYHRYLSVIAADLRGIVAPELQSGRAKAALAAAVRTLGRLAYLMDPAVDTLGIGEISDLPESIRIAFESALAEAGMVNRAWRPAAQDPPEDISFRQPLAPAMAVAAEWLKSADWSRSVQLRATAASLVAWDRGLLGESETRSNELEEPVTSGPSATKMMEIDRAKLEHYLQKRFAQHAGVRIIEFLQVAGGRSKQTAVFTLEGVPELPQRLVVRRDHPIGIGMSVVKEFPAIARAHREGMKVARPFFVEPARDVLGGSFAVAECVRGRVPTDYWDCPKSERLALSLAEQLAKLHAIDYSELSTSLDCSIDLKSNHPWLDDLDRLDAIVTRMGNAPSMIMGAAFGWMRQNIDVVTSRLSLVHADAHFHNIHVEGEEFVALLDWELVHIGHPVEDLGYCRPVVEKMTTWSRFMDAYVASGGVAPAQPEVDYFTLREIIRLITMLLPARNLVQDGSLKDVLIAEIGTDFINRLVYRLSEALQGVLR